MPAELKGLDLKALKEKQICYATQVRLCGVVLWGIAYSQALHHHLSALHRGGILGFPTNGSLNFTQCELDLLLSQKITG